MNKQAILKTAICYWSKEDDCYIVESPLLEPIAGVGENPEEALRIFKNLLSDAYEAYLEGRMPGYDKPGRPAKGNVTFNTDLQPETKERIRTLASHIGCSMGEIVDYLLFYYDHVKPETSRNQIKHSQSLSRSNKINSPTLAGISKRLANLESLVEKVHQDIHNDSRQKKHKQQHANASVQNAIPDFLQP